MAKKLATKRNPQDATLRNIRALKKRVARLEDQMAYIYRRKGRNHAPLS